MVSKLATRPILVSVIGALMFGHCAVRAQDSPPLEYRVKAAFLYHFLQFVEWPTNAFVSQTSPITICVLGDDQFGPILDETVGSKTVGQRKIVIKRCRQVGDLDSCHLLFISRSEKERLPQILPRQDGSNTLTVGEVEEFLQQCGVINFTMVEGKVRFEINPNAARRAGLQISSQVLKLAKVVRAECPRGEK